MDSEMIRMRVENFFNMRKSSTTDSKQSWKKKAAVNSKRTQIILKTHWEQNMSSSNESKVFNKDEYFFYKATVHTYARGRITAHDVPGICQAGVTIGVERITMAAMARIERKRASRNRFTILGTSIQKLDLSTSYAENNT